VYNGSEISLSLESFVFGCKDVVDFIPKIDGWMD
jgi:hypothetical protein